MQIAHFQNPFYEFIKSCNESWIDIDNIPRTSRDHILGTCTFFDTYWKNLDKISTYIPTLYIISLDGVGSKELYKIWEKHHLTNKTLIPEHILKNEKAVILFDNSAEGHCDNYMFKFISQVVDMYKLNPNTTFYGNSAMNIKEIHERTEYKNFKTMYLANFQEDTMTELYEELKDLDVTYDNKTNLFSCLNNAPKPHRALLLGALPNTQDSLISTPTVDWQELYSNTIKFLLQQSQRKQITAQDFEIGLEYLQNLKQWYPQTIDKRTDDVVHMKQVSADNKFVQKLLDCDFQLITETFSDHTLVLTEKIFKAIIMKQPFIILGPNRIYKFLQERGYKTFDHLLGLNTWKGTSNYDSETNIIKKIQFLITHLETLSMYKDNPTQWKEIEQKNKADAEYNYEVFKTNMNKITNSATDGLESWLQNYADFKMLFDIDIDKY